MDWTTFVFVVFVSGSIIYGGLFVWWSMKWIFGDLIDRVFVSIHMKPLVFVLFLFTMAWAIMLLLHITGVITMWGVGYVLSR